MEAFADLGMFESNTNVNNEINTLQSPDLMREVVSRLHLDMDYHVSGHFHKQTIYGSSLPIMVSILNSPEDESVSFTLELSKGGHVRLSDFKKNGNDTGNNEIEGKLNHAMATPLGK